MSKDTQLSQFDPNEKLPIGVLSSPVDIDMDVINDELIVYDSQGNSKNLGKFSAEPSPGFKTAEIINQDLIVTDVGVLEDAKGFAGNYHIIKYPNNGTEVSPEEYITEEGYVMTASVRFNNTAYSLEEVINRTALDNGDGYLFGSSTGQYILFDFLTETTINSYLIQNMRSDWATLEYEIQASNDNENFITIDSHTLSSGTPGTLEFRVVGEQSYRFYKFVPITTNNNGSIGRIDFLKSTNELKRNLGKISQVNSYSYQFNGSGLRIEQEKPTEPEYEPSGYNDDYYLVSYPNNGTVVSPEEYITEEGYTITATPRLNTSYTLEKTINRTSSSNIDGYLFSNTPGKYIKYNFNKKLNVSGVLLQNMRSDYAIIDFELQISDDDSSYSTVFSGSLPQGDPGVIFYAELPVDTSCQYIRLVPITTSNTGSIGRFDILFDQLYQEPFTYTHNELKSGRGIDILERSDSYDLTFPFEPTTSKTLDFSKYSRFEEIIDGIAPAEPLSPGDTKRQLNTVRWNNNSLSFSNNNVTVGPGIYYIKASTIANSTTESNIMIKDGLGNVLIESPPVSVPDGVVTELVMSGEIIINETTNISLFQNNSSLSSTGNTLGIPFENLENLYSVLEIYYISNTVNNYESLYQNTSLIYNSDTLNDTTEKSIIISPNTPSKSTIIHNFGDYSSELDMTTPINIIMNSSFENDWTLESWVYINNNGTVFNLGNILNVEFLNGNILILDGTMTYIESEITNGNWVHVAISKVGSTMYLFLDGQQVNGSMYTGTGDNTISILPNNELIYVDDIRATLGVARYSSNFAPPTEKLTPYYGN